MVGSPVLICRGCPQSLQANARTVPHITSPPSTSLPIHCSAISHSPPVTTTSPHDTATLSILVRFSAGAINVAQNVHTSSDPSSLLTMGTGGMKHLLPGLRMRSYTSTPLYTFTAYIGEYFYTRNHVRTKEITMRGHVAP